MKFRCEFLVRKYACDENLKAYTVCRKVTLIIASPRSKTYFCEIYHVPPRFHTKTLFFLFFRKLWKVI